MLPIRDNYETTNLPTVSNFDLYEAVCLSVASTRSVKSAWILHAHVSISAEVKFWQNDKIEVSGESYSLKSRITLMLDYSFMIDNWTHVTQSKVFYNTPQLSRLTDITNHTYLIWMRYKLYWNWKAKTDLSIPLRNGKIAYLNAESHNILNTFLLCWYRWWDWWMKAYHATASDKHAKIQSTRIHFTHKP